MKLYQDIPGTGDQTQTPYFSGAAGIIHRVSAQKRTLTKYSFQTPLEAL